MLVPPFHKNLGHQVEGALWQSFSGRFRVAIPPFLAVIWREALFVHRAEQPDFPNSCSEDLLFFFYVFFFTLCFTFPLPLPSDKKFQPHSHSLTYTLIAFSHSIYFPQGSQMTFSSATIPFPSFQIRMSESKLAKTPEVLSVQGKKTYFLFWNERLMIKAVQRYQKTNFIRF